MDLHIDQKLDDKVSDGKTGSGAEKINSQSKEVPGVLADVGEPDKFCFSSGRLAIGLID